jgi:RNA polymerase sigma-70 factor (ECF subfamily)
MKELMEPHVDEAELRPSDFGVFYRETWNRVYRPLAVTLRDHELAREAVDEAMVRAFQKWSKVCRYDNPPGWVYRVALNFAKNRMRRRWREIPLASIEPSWEMTTPNPEVMQSVLGLPMRQREIVVLRFLFDWSVQEVSDALGIPEGTVKSRLHRAMAALREMMR